VSVTVVPRETIESAPSRTLDDALRNVVGLNLQLGSSNTIQPTTQAKVYNSNDDAVSALKAKQIDGLVVDLPTAFYIAFGELTNGVLVGQLANSASGTEQLGFVLQEPAGVDATHPVLGILQNDIDPADPLTVAVNERRLHVRHGLDGAAMLGDDRHLGAGAGRG